MGQRVVHVVVTDLVQGRVPDSVLLGEQVGQELKEVGGGGGVATSAQRRFRPRLTQWFSTVTNTAPQPQIRN